MKGNPSSETARGFAGLSSLVSVGRPPPVSKAASDVPRTSGDGAPAAAPPIKTSSPKPTEKDAKPVETAFGPNPGDGKSFWNRGSVIGLVVVLFFGWVYVKSQERPARPAANAYSDTYAATPAVQQPAADPTANSYSNTYAANPAVQQPAAAPTANSYSNNRAANPAVQQPAAPPQPARKFEDKPATGEGLVLTSNQVRYCLSEDIRLEAIRAIVDHYSDSHVANFNARIADFNARCSSYKYRKSEMERLRSEVESNRYQLQAQARSIVAGW